MWWALCWPVGVSLVVLNFSFLVALLGRACQRNDLASVVTASVMLLPRVTRLGLRIVTGLEVGIVWGLFWFFSLGNDVFPVLWLLGQPPHRLHNTTLHRQFYPSALSPQFFQFSNRTLVFTRLPGPLVLILLNLLVKFVHQMITPVSLFCSFRNIKFLHNLHTRCLSVCRLP